MPRAVCRPPHEGIFTYRRDSNAPRCPYLPHVFAPDLHHRRSGLHSRFTPYDDTFVNRNIHAISKEDFEKRVQEACDLRILEHRKKAQRKKRARIKAHERTAARMSATPKAPSLLDPWPDWKRPAFHVRWSTRTLAPGLGVVPLSRECFT